MSVVQPILLTAGLVFLLAGSLLGIAVGAALLARSARARSLFAALNRWISTRRVLRPVELPRETGHGNRALGVVLLVAGAYALVVLMQVPVARLAAVLRIDSVLGLIAIDALKWLLVAGCAASVATGALLAFLPRAWAGLEARANQWVSSRQLTAGGDDMHVPLEHLAERHPRAAGALILLLSLASTAASALLLLRH